LRILAQVLLFVLFLVIREFISLESDIISHSIMSFGILIFTGYLLGSYISRIQLPRITGYMLAGILCGPYFFGIVNRPVINELEAINHIALALIAFSAGGGLKNANILPQWRCIMSISFLQTIGIFIVSFLGMYIAMPIWGNITMSPLYMFWGSVFIALIATACSPASSIAVIVDTNAKGMLTDNILGTTVVRDVIVLIIYTFVTAIAVHKLGTEQGEVQSVLHELISLVLSFGIGALVGVGISLLLSKVRRDMTFIFIVLSCVIVYLSEIISFHFVIACLTAGYIVENYSQMGDDLMQSLKRSSIPIYIVFFAIAGAALDITVLIRLWPLVCIGIICRYLGTYIGTYTGALITCSSKDIKYYSANAYISQAGVSIGLSMFLIELFPMMVDTVLPLLLAMIQIHQIIGPIILRWTLNKTHQINH